jgi:hypothetical protein
LEISNVGQLCPTFSHSSNQDRICWALLTGKIGRVYCMNVYDGLCISDDNVWQSRPLLIVCECLRKTRSLEVNCKTNSPKMGETRDT